MRELPLKLSASDEDLIEWEAYMDKCHDEVTISPEAMEEANILRGRYLEVEPAYDYSSSVSAMIRSLSTGSIWIRPFEFLPQAWPHCIEFNFGYYVSLSCLFLKENEMKFCGGLVPGSLSYNELK
eukprot:Trichotokara_eunicae@DN4476_c0_g1_i1.p1